jgi:hypothetical protein
MQTTLICKNCRREVPANPHLKGNQQYCGDSECQRVRECAWQKAKMTTDSQYREKHRLSHHRWCQQYPLHRYQDQYRQSHSKYVEKNRELQKTRNQKRRKRPEAAQGDLIVKMDASPIIKSGTYLLTPYALDASSQKIVKMDAFVVQLQLLQQDDRQLLAQGR